MTNPDNTPLPVDYSLETSTIFIRAAVASFLAYEEDLEPLGWVGDQAMSQIESLPTWAVFRRTAHFKASGNFKRKFWYVILKHHPRIIIFNEMTFDTVNACCPAFWTSPGDCHLGEILQILLDKDAGHSAYQMALSQVLMSVLIRGEENIPEECLDREALISEFQDWLFQQTCITLAKEGLGEADVLPANISESLEKLKKSLMLRDRFSEFTRAISSGSQRHHKWADVQRGLRGDWMMHLVDTYFKKGMDSFRQNFRTLWERTCKERCVFMTNRGYVGLGPRTARAGDRVCILEGGRVPYLFRQVPGKDENTVTFVGDAYVHGIMYGEALEGQKVEFEKLLVL